jgi:hypothetical protein
VITTVRLSFTGNGSSALECTRHPSGFIRVISNKFLAISPGKAAREAPSDVKPRVDFTLPFAE